MPAGTRTTRRADEILCLPDGRFGFRVVDPATGKRHAASGFDELREAERAADEAETRRLYYVAMTRAIDRLIVSGAVDPTSTRDAKAPIRWILDRLEADLESGQPVELEREGARVLLRVDRRDAGTAEPDESRGRPARALRRGRGRRDAGRTGAAAARARSRSRPPSASAASPTARSRSSDAARTVSTPSESPGCARPQPSAAVAGAEGLVATEIGDAVHVLLEHGVAAAGDRRTRRSPLSGGDCRGSRARRVARRRLARLTARRRAPRAAPSRQPELAFAFEHDGVLLHGRFDLFRLADGRALVVDYKTNRLEDLTPEEALEDDYSLQRLVYALAAFRAGAEEVEVVYVFLERPEDVVAADLRPRRGPRARGRAVGGDRGDPRRRVSPDAERVRMRRLPGARRRLRRAAPPALLRSRCRPR